VPLCLFRKVTYLFTCADDPLEETKCFEINAEISRQCRAFGMPHVIEAMAANGGFAKADNRDCVSLNCRIAGEMGADVIKTDWCGPEGIARITSQSLAPIGIAGGAANDDINSLTEVVTIETV
jgi:DhnA family fructose-bisphosphate aldolase class Ia